MEDKTICWARGDRCHGCPHYHKKAKYCSHRPPLWFARLLVWIARGCSFKNIWT